MPFAGLVVAEKEKQTFVVAVFQKSGGQKREEVCSHGEQDSTTVPKFASSLILPRGNLVGECLPQTLLCGLRRKNFLLPIPAFRAIYVRCKVKGKFFCKVATD